MNPWAWALVAGVKDCENRGWALPGAMRHQRVLIHCGLHKPTSDEIGQVKELSDAAGIEMPPWAIRPIGGLIGSLVFVGDCTPQQISSVWATGPRCWLVGRGTAVAFRAAIVCKGQQGFFEVPREVSQRFR